MSKDTRIVLVILLAIVAATLINLRVSFRKARDAQRKADIRSIYDALMKYQHEFGFFPASSEDGRIMACGGRLDEKGFPVFDPCQWYEDALQDVFDPSYPAYLKVIPGDPRQGQGRSYYYLSNSKHFQIYASLESDSEDEYEPAVVNRNLPCGQYICNVGRSDGKTPLDKSLQEYENELLELESKNAT